MPTVTSVVDPQRKKRPNSRFVYLDGRHAFTADQAVLDQFSVREGVELSPQQLLEIHRAELHQECVRQAVKELGERPQSTPELRRRLLRQRFRPDSVESALDEIRRQGLLDDLKSATQIAQRLLRQKMWGQERVREKLLFGGFEQDVVDRAIKETYAEADGAALLMTLARKLSARVRKLDAETARRRLGSALQNRGFGYLEVRAALDKVLGPLPEDE